MATSGPVISIRRLEKGRGASLNRSWMCRSALFVHAGVTAHSGRSACVATSTVVGAMRSIERLSHAVLTPLIGPFCNVLGDVGSAE